MNTLDDVRNSGNSTLQDSSVRTSEICPVHVDAECISLPQQAGPSPLHTDEDRFSAEKAGVESEMDSSDISNVSAANLVRTTYQNSE